MDLAHAEYMVRYEIPRRIGQARERAIRFIVWHLLPRRVVMWAGFRIIAHATTGQWSRQEVPALTAMDAMKRWDTPRDDNAPKAPSSPTDRLVVREETLHKVADALRRAGLPEQKTIDTIFDMQNSGIYFREAKPEEEPIR